MNRTDELTDRLIDGTLTDAEAGELNILLSVDPAAQTRHLASLRLELVLRGLRAEFEIAGPTVAKIETDRAERTVEAVLAGLADRPPPEPDRRPRRRGVWVAAAAVVAALLVAIRLALQPAGVPALFDHDAPVVPDVARVTTLSGSVEVVGIDGPAAAYRDQALTPGQTLRTVGEESTAVVEFPDHTRVEVHPDTAVRLVPTSGGAAVRKLFLEYGQVAAVVTGGNTVVGAGTAEVEARHGSFAMWSSGTGAARVERRDGDVRVIRAPAEPLVLGPGRSAFVRDEATPVRIEKLVPADTRPRDRLNFAALDVGLTPDGEVWAVSAKQWARWRPGTPDPGRTAFPPAVFNDGVAAWLTPDRRAIAVCRIDDREERIIVRALPSGDEKGQIPVRVSEPRFLCVGPDASWVATTGGPKLNNRRVRVWDVATGQERFAFDLDNSVTCLTASPNGRGLAVGVSNLGKDAGNVVAVFDVTTGTRMFDLPTRRKSITTLTFSADGKHLVAGFNGAVQVWDVPSLKLHRTFEGFERAVTRLAYSPAGDLLAAGTQDGQVWVWSARTGRRTQVIETGTRGVRSLAFSPDGKFLVTATNKAAVAVWDVTPAPVRDAEPDA